MFDSINLETRSRCNRQCYDCFNHNRFKKRQQGQMAISTFRRIIYQLRVINFQGRLGFHMFNEPLLDRRLPRLVRHAKKMIPKCNIYIATNGDYLGIRQYRDLTRAGIDRILFTDYGPEWTRKNITKPKIDYRKHTEVNKRNRAGKLYSTEEIINKPCLRPQRQLVINWKGQVLLCCCDYYGEFSFGIIRRRKLIKKATHRCA